jgi:hypothetical protein
MGQGLRSNTLLRLGLVAGVCGRPGMATADEVAGTRSHLVEEREHAIDLAMDYDHAQLVVRRTVYNGGERHDQAVFWIDLPEGAVAAGLRTLGSKNGRPHWFDGKLLEAEAAAARYRELTGIGGYYPKDPALLSWRSQRHLALQVFPVEPRGPKTIEYTLHLPTEYVGGRYRVSLPAIGTDRRRAEAVLRPAHRLDQVFVNDEAVGRGKRVVLDQPIEVAVARRDAPRLEGRLASFPFDDDRVLVQYEMQASARLSQIPTNARIVVLLDTSRSLPEEHVKASIAAARAYLHHFSARALRARAEVVTFARTPARRFDAMVDADRVLADLETFEPTRENGSHVDRALEQASAILADAPRGSHRRIVLFTDTLTRSSLQPARLRALATRSGAILHVVSTSATSQPVLERDDAHAWASVTRATGGVVWTAAASEDASARAEMHATFEELARPVRIDGLTVHVAGLPADRAPSQITLDEGEGFGDLLIAGQNARYLAVEGELWSRPIREVVTPSGAHAKLWAGLVFGTDLLDELSEPEMMRLAMHGRVVSPVTSYLAIEPGVRPSTEGLDWNGGTGSGFGVGFGRRGARVRNGRLPSTFDPERWLQARLRDALDRCGAAQAKATTQLETTRAEIADVTSLSVERADAVTHDCVREEIWGFELPSEFSRPFATWTVRSRA